MGAVGWCVCGAGQSSDNGARLSGVTALGRRSGAAFWWRLEPLTFCRPAEAQVFCLLQPLRRLLLHATILRTAPAVAMAAIPVRGGRVRFQSGNPEVDLGRSATQPANRAPARELSPRGGVRGSGVMPVTGGMGRGRIMRSATAVSQKLPLKVANIIGPWVSPGLPW